MLKNKYYGPITENLNYINSLIKEGAKVLEIGPGHIPFSKATDFCGWQDSEKEKLNNYKVADASSEMLPYKNKEFDFIYCRHVVEDLWNPINALKEMSRIGKEGYIETPSPLAEMCKGIEGPNERPAPWRGYIHHRYLLWNDSNVLNILPKFPIIEYSSNERDDKIYNLLNTNPFVWNMYYHWKDSINYKLHVNGIGKDFTFLNDEYFKLIFKGINTEMNNSVQQMKKVGINV